MGYKEEYNGNKVIIETEDKTIKYEVALVYEGNSLIFDSDDEYYDELQSIMESTFLGNKSALPKTL